MRSGRPSVETLLIANTCTELENLDPTLKSSFFGPSGIVEYPEEKWENPVPGVHECHPRILHSNQPKCFRPHYDTIEDER